MITALINEQPSYYKEIIVEGSMQRQFYYITGLNKRYKGPYDVAEKFDEQNSHAYNV